MRVMDVIITFKLPQNWASWEESGVIVGLLEGVFKKKGG